MKTLRWRALLAAFVLFAVGFVAGSAITVVVAARVVRNLFIAPADAPAPIDRTLARFEESLTEDYALTPAQQAALHAEIGRSATRLKQLRVETSQHLRDEIHLIVERLAAELPPEHRLDFYAKAHRRFDWMGLDLTAPVDPH